MQPRLIYCADGNKRFAETALRQGFWYGAQLPNKVYFTPSFTDQNWKNPDRVKYMATLREHRTALATVLDWEREDQYSEVMSWADEASQYVSDAVIIIPKVVGGIKRLPRSINGKQVRLGYSASSTFSSTPVYLNEFRGWPVHCLGGSVSTQRYVSRFADVHSVDGNYLQRIAREWCEVFSPAAIDYKRAGYVRLRMFSGFVGRDSMYLAFELSLIGVRMLWEGFDGQAIYEAQIAFLDSIGLSPEKRQVRLFS